jgi:uncharacterized protein YukE
VSALPFITWQFPVGAIVRLRTDPPGPHAGADVKIKSQIRSVNDKPCYITHLVGDDPKHDFYIMEDRIAELVDASQAEASPAPERPTGATQRIPITRRAPEPMPKKELPEPVDPTPRREVLRLTPAQVQEKPVESTPFKDLNPVDQADRVWEALQRGWTNRHTAEHFGVSATWVSHLSRLARAEPEIREAVRAGKMSVETAIRQSQVPPRSPGRPSRATTPEPTPAQDPEEQRAVEALVEAEAEEQETQPSAWSVSARQWRRKALDAGEVAEQRKEHAEAWCARALAAEKERDAWKGSAETWLGESRRAEQEATKYAEEIAALKAKLAHMTELIEETEVLHHANRKLIEERDQLQIYLQEALATRQTININGGTVTIITKES